MTTSISLAESSTDPTQEPNKIEVYGKDVAGTTQLFARSDDGTVHQITPAAGASSQLLSIYGDGHFGDYTTAGDETWTSLAGAPGAPAVPTGSPLPFAFFDNLTISPGDAVTVGGLSGQPLERAVVIFVKGTLTIGAGAAIHADGADGAGSSSFGRGRNAIIGSESGGDGGEGRFGIVAPAVGVGGTDRPAQSSAARIGGAGGTGSIGFTDPGAIGGIDTADPSWPYSLSSAMSIVELLTAIGGGNGGGGGGAGTSLGGSGGSGGGTLVIFARNIVAPAGSIRARGGAGAPGDSQENIPSGGGGGGTGGTILIVTENTTLLGVTNVSGGAGGAGDGIPAGGDGGDGGPGEAIAFNPTLAAQIPT